LFKKGQQNKFQQLYSPEHRGVPGQHPICNEENNEALGDDGSGLVGGGERGWGTVKRRIGGFLGGRRRGPGEGRGKAERGGGKGEKEGAIEGLCCVH